MEDAAQDPHYVDPRDDFGPQVSHVAVEGLLSVNDHSQILIMSHILHWLAIKGQDRCQSGVKGHSLGLSGGDHKSCTPGGGCQSVECALGTAERGFATSYKRQVVSLGHNMGPWDGSC